MGERLGAARSVDGDPLEIEVTFESTPSAMYDAVVIPPGQALALRLSRDGRVLEFLRDQFRHDKPFLVVGAGRSLLAAAGIPVALPDGAPDPGIVFAKAGRVAEAVAAFEAALARHEAYARETDPPRV